MEQKALMEQGYCRTRGKRTPSFPSETVFAVREAISVQEEISGLLKEFPSLFPMKQFPHLNAQNAPEDMAIQVRKDLGISIEDQLSWVRDDSFRFWRTRVQELGVLVLAKPMPVDDCSGFSLISTNGLIPTIVVNKKESPEDNAFALFHELGHLLLLSEGICAGIKRDEAIEKWCNDFAGAILVPVEALYAVAPEFKPNITVDWTIRRVQGMARKLKVGKDVIALRLEHLKSAKSDLYERVIKSPRVIPRCHRANNYRATRQIIGQPGIVGQSPSGCSGGGSARSVERRSTGKPSTSSDQTGCGMSTPTTPARAGDAAMNTQSTGWNIPGRIYLEKEDWHEILAYRSRNINHVCCFSRFRHSDVKR